MSELRAAGNAINSLLNQIASHFAGEPKITLVVRHPDFEAGGLDADFIMTNDTFEGAVAALERRNPRRSAGDGAPLVPTRPGGASPNSGGDA